jgi:hypothetical protein
VLPLLPGSPLVPPEAQAIINSVVRSGPSNTKKLIEELRPLEELGFTSQEAAIVGFGRFPVAGYASYIDDWLYPRFFPTFHFHQGNDIFGAYGSPVRAPADGVVRITNGSIGGLAVYVTEPDGTYWYMAHLASLHDGLAEGQTVRIGDVVGYLGDSGDAKGGVPHVHFELHPGGGGAVDPKSVLDTFLADAVANAPKLVQWYERREPRGLVATGLVRRLLDNDVDALTVDAARPSRSQILWASAGNPAGGALQLADAEAAEAAREVNWDERAREQQDRLEAWTIADNAARQLLAPLSTKAVASAMAASSSAG